MRFDRLTVKAQEAMQEAQNLAGKFNQQEITPEHMLAAMLQQEEGVVPAVLKKIGVNTVKLAEDVIATVKTLPQVTGATTGQVYLSATLKRVFDPRHGRMDVPARDPGTSRSAPRDGQRAALRLPACHREGEPPGPGRSPGLCARPQRSTGLGA